MHDKTFKRVAQVLGYSDAGFALTPIPSGQKGPQKKGWNGKENALTTPEQVKGLTENMGILHVWSTPPTAAIDFDQLDKARTFMAEYGIDVDALLDAPDAVLISSGRQNRAKLLYRLPEGVEPLQTKQIRDEQAEVIFELRCADASGKSVQDVLPPSIHPVTGQEYYWGGKGHFSRVPTLPDNVLLCWQKLLTPQTPVTDYASAPANTALSSTDMDRVRRAVFYFDADDRERWVNFGMSLKGLGDVGRELWLEWSATSDKFNPEKDPATWDTFNPEKLDYRHIFKSAGDNGWDNPAKHQDDPLSWHFSSEALKVTESNAPKPLPPELLPVKPLDPAWLPESIRDGVVDIATRLNCPIDYVAVAAIACAGSVLGNRVGIRPKQRDTTWIVHTGLWGGIVGAPGTMKTPALMAALKALNQLEEQAANDYANAMAQYRQDKLCFETDLKLYQKGKTSQVPIEPVPPRKKRYMVNDTTYQALGEVLSGNPQGVIAVADELSGLLQSLDSAGQEAARGFYLSGWGGQQSYRFDRVSRGEIILHRYQLSVFGGFQPDRIKAYVQQAQGGRQNDGLLQRFQLLVWPDQLNEIKYVDQMPDLQALQSMENAIMNLRVLASRPITGAVMHGLDVQALHFDAEAQMLFEQWYLANEKLVRKPDIGVAIEGHYSKYRSLVPALALLFHLLDGCAGPVCLGCLEKAIQFTAYLKSHAKRIYASIHDADLAPARALANRLKENKLSDGFTVRDVYLKGWAHLSDQACASSAVKLLTAYEWLREEHTEGNGRPTYRYFINPQVGRTSIH